MPQVFNNSNKKTHKANDLEEEEYNMELVEDALPVNQKIIQQNEE